MQKSVNNWMILKLQWANIDTEKDKCRQDKTDKKNIIQDITALNRITAIDCCWDRKVVVEFKKERTRMFLKSHRREWSYSIHYLGTFERVKIFKNSYRLVSSTKNIWEKPFIWTVVRLFEPYISDCSKCYVPNEVVPLVSLGWLSLHFVTGTIE